MITTERLQQIRSSYEANIKGWASVFHPTNEERISIVDELLALRQQLEAQDGGWIEWRGDDKPSDFEYPLPCNTRVEVKSCAGRTYSGCVGEFIWDDNIIAYRVVSYPAI